MKCAASPSGDRLHAAICPTAINIQWADGFQWGSLWSPFYCTAKDPLMDYVAVFVDAGYLFAQGSTLLTGRKLQRSEIRLNADRVVDALTTVATRASRQLPLLRIYWYDGTSGEPSDQHRTLARHANIKVRLGIVNRQGQQKGVDSLLVTDMITLARNRAMAECVLLSGDEDMRVGVLQAQEHGVRVHLLGIRGVANSQSELLVQEADERSEWGEDDLHPFLTCTPRPQPEAAEAAAPLTPEDVDRELAQVARDEAGDVPAADREALIRQIRQTGLRPRAIDGRLLAKSRTAIGGTPLDDAQREYVRTAFLNSLARLEEAAAAAGDG